MKKFHMPEHICSLHLIFNENGSYNRPKQNDKKPPFFSELWRGWCIFATNCIGYIYFH